MLRKQDISQVAYDALKYKDQNTLYCIVSEEELRRRAYLSDYHSKIKEKLLSTTGMFTDEGFMVDLAAVLYTIDFLYNSEVPNATNGSWFLEPDEEEPNPMFKHVVCTACGGKSNTTYKYCPNCGIKMK